MSNPRPFKLLRQLGEQTIGREARSQSGDHSAVKLWLRLLSCSTQIEQEIRTRLRQRFATTLPRFDYLAQLEVATITLNRPERKNPLTFELSYAELRDLFRA
jgi:hypothetical protein